MGRLDGKVVIVTGGTRGMGEAEVRGVVAEGGKVVFGGRDEDAGRRIEAELGGGAVYVKQDVTLPADWDRVIQTAQDAFGAIHGLVNNAGYSMGHRLERISDEQVDRIIGINQLGVFRGMQRVVGPMRAAGGGSIVNISSVAALRPLAGISVYAGAKAAVAAMTRSVAKELAAEGIRVNVVFPGYFDTQLLEDSSRGKGVEMGVEQTPMKRVAHPREIVGPIVFLLSDEASFVTGAELAVDGGLSI